MKVLVAEDDQFTRDGLVEVLESEGYQVVAAADGTEAIQQFRDQQPDFVCLDIMMPSRSGYEACSAIRAASPDVPIIFISAKAEEVDRLVGFEVGADDFIAKPFSVREVVARVRAVARRCCAATPDVPAEFSMGNLTVLPGELRAKRGDNVIDLSPRDVKILQLLHDNPGKALDRNVIFNHAWGEDYFPNSRTLDQHISQLRKRVEVDPKEPNLICTVHGVGYRYDPNA
ncbi:MAG: response regulator transcription factor [Fuerstiella sp.]|nr:response regulator transcription factor [Fuerstiella sp.]MCP4858039.1 response regulator transcription factor [Fuerstiella sp.]